MALYVSNKQNLVPDGEYTAKIIKISPTQKGDNITFRCAITTEGFDNTVVLGFCGAHWRPSNRTTANLLQWCRNLGMEVVPGREEECDIESLVGKECRVIVQGYTSRDGTPRVKVSNILPFDKKPVSKPVLKSPGLHIGNNGIINNQTNTVANTTPMQHTEVAQQNVVSTTPVQQASAAAPTQDTPAQSDVDDLW